MNHEHNQDELIELGTATVETKGAFSGVPDSERTLQPIAGLSDD